MLLMTPFPLNLQSNFAAIYPSKRELTHSATAYLIQWCYVTVIFCYLFYTFDSVSLPNWSPCYLNIIPFLQPWGSNFSVKPATNKIHFCLPIPAGCHFSVKDYTTEVPMSLMIMLVWTINSFYQKPLNIFWLRTLPPIMNLPTYSYLKKSWLTAHFTTKPLNWTHFETRTPPIDYSWPMLLML